MDIITLTIGILIFITQQIGAHYITKILDKVDEKILDFMGRDKDILDFDKLKLYLQSHPDIIEELRKEATAFTIIYPRKPSLDHDDRISLYAFIINMIIEVMKSQKRDISTCGFFNSPDTISIFKKVNDLKPVIVESKQINFFPSGLDIYIFHKDDFLKSGISPDEVNSRIRDHRTSNVDYASVDKLSNISNLIHTNYRVEHLYPDYLAFNHKRYLDYYSGSEIIKDITKDDIINTENRKLMELSLINEPYPGMEEMIQSLKSEVGRIYLPEEEAAKFYNILEKAKTVIHRDICSG